MLFAGIATVAVAASGPMTTVANFVAAFNRGDMSAAVATCAPVSSVLDDFPPHAWPAPNGCAAWATSFVRTAKANGWTAVSITLGTPRQVDVTGSSAYIVVPADIALKVHGKPAGMKGSTLTVALERFPSGWKMTSWAWADR